MPKRLMDCVKKVSAKMGKNHAWPICVKSTGQTPHRRIKTAKRKAYKK